MKKQSNLKTKTKRKEALSRTMITVCCDRRNGLICFEAEGEKKKRWVGRRGGKDSKIKYIYELFLSLSQNPRDRNTKFWGHSKHGFPKE